jgi:3-oxoacyl-[acyl-carrier protein] reductase
MRTLRGKTALVTGAASGIGRAITIALARERADLYLVDIDDINLESAALEARSHGVAVVTRHCDLAEPTQITATVDTLLAHWGGRLNVLINNAGIADRCFTHEMSDAQWNRIIAVNLLAPIQLTRMLLPTLLANDAHLLNVCSIFGLVTTRKAAAYQTSKFGLVGFTTALRAEYGSPEFGVTALCPGFVKTPMMDRIADAQPRKFLRHG